MNVVNKNTIPRAIKFKTLSNVNEDGFLITSEAGKQAQLQISLSRQPSEDVTITLDGNDDAEGILSTDSLRFTSDNWNEPQLITIQGVDDAIVDKDKTYTLTATASDSGGYSSEIETSFSIINIADGKAYDKNNDGFADQTEPLTLFNAGKPIQVINSGVPVPSDAQTPWMALKAVKLDDGFQILLEHKTKENKKFNHWQLSQSGVVQQERGWKTASQMSKEGFELTFNLDLDKNGIIGFPPVSDKNGDGFKDGTNQSEIIQAIN